MNTPEDQASALIKEFDADMQSMTDTELKSALEQAGITTAPPESQEVEELVLNLTADVAVEVVAWMLEDTRSGNADKLSKEIARRIFPFLSAFAASQQKEREDICDACGGSGMPVSGKPCMCKGTGKMSVAALTLREAYVAAEATASRQAKEIGELRKALQKIAAYDDEPIWMDDRDDAANEMLEIASDALGGCGGVT